MATASADGFVRLWSLPWGGNAYQSPQQNSSCAADGESETEQSSAAAAGAEAQHTQDTAAAAPRPAPSPPGEEPFQLLDEIDASDSGAVTHVAVTAAGASKHGLGPLLVRSELASSPYSVLRAASGAEPARSPPAPPPPPQVTAHCHTQREEARVLVWDLAVPHRTRPLQQHALAFPDRGSSAYRGRVQSLHLQCVAARGAGQCGEGEPLAAGCAAAAGARKGRRPTVQAFLAVRARSAEGPVACVGCSGARMS